MPLELGWCACGAATFLLGAALAAGAFFELTLAACFFFAPDFFGAGFLAAGLAGIGMVMPGMCWCWATAGAERDATAIALTATDNLGFTTSTPTGRAPAKAG